MKVKLAEALNNGDNEKVCKIILDNEMDSQAWDMFITGMDLRNAEAYRPLLGKIKEFKEKIYEEFCVREVLRLKMLIEKLEE